MRFMLLVKSDAASEAGVPPDPKELSAMNQFNDEMIKANVLLAGEGLHASSKGARVRCNKATKKVTVLDGPFAEAKELVAGFWIIQAKSKDDALEWAKRVPFKGGEVEVRPIFESEDFPPDPNQGANEAWRKTEFAARESLSRQTTRGTKKMRFIGFVKGAADSESGKLPETDALDKMGAFIGEAVKAGVFLGGEGLKPTSAGAKVRYDGAKRTVLDGPFTEAKEIVAGYSILAVDSKEEAVEWTKRFAVVDSEIRTIPEVECEIRRIFEDEEFPPA
jgi:hypothetical protein